MSNLHVREQRLAMTDALMPPAGYRLGAAIGTTYSVDFDALTAVLLAFAGAECEEDEARIGTTVTSLARMRSRFRLFVDAASMHVGEPHRLYALFDRIVRPVRIANMAFHPKVWALRFEPVQKPERTPSPQLFRVLVSSRNLTDSRYWELAAVVSGKSGQASSPFGADVSAFLRRVTGKTDLPKECWKLLSDLQTADVEAAREWKDGLRLRWQFPAVQRLEPQLPTGVRRALVISPFLRDEFLKVFVPRCEQLTLVSTQKAFDDLPDTAHERLDGVRKLVVTDAAADEGLALDLHAKFIAWEDDGGREACLGSANATAAGWGLAGRVNAEAMLSMRPGPSIADVMRAFVTSRTGEYHPWIEEYGRRAPEPEETEEGELIDRARRAIAQDQPLVSYDAGTKELLVRCAHGDAPAGIPAGVTVDVRPLLGDANVWRPYDKLRDGGAVFPSVAFEDVSAFLMVRLRSQGLQEPTEFCLQGELAADSNMLDTRDALVSARLLEGLDPATLLLNVLEGLPAGSGAQMAPSTGEPSATRGRLLRRATIERVMEACTADPGRIDEIDAVLTASAQSSALEDFVRFWSEFKAALSEVPSHG